MWTRPGLLESISIVNRSKNGLKEGVFPRFKRIYMWNRPGLLEAISLVIYPRY